MRKQCPLCRLFIDREDEQKTSPHCQRCDKELTRKRREVRVEQELTEVAKEMLAGMRKSRNRDNSIDHGQAMDMFVTRVGGMQKCMAYIGDEMKRQFETDNLSKGQDRLRFMYGELVLNHFKEVTNRDAAADQALEDMTPQDVEEFVLPTVRTFIRKYPDLLKSVAEQLLVNDAEFRETVCKKIGLGSPVVIESSATRKEGDDA